MLLAHATAHLPRISMCRRCGAHRLNGLKALEHLPLGVALSYRLVIAQRRLAHLTLINVYTSRFAPSPHLYHLPIWESQIYNRCSNRASTFSALPQPRETSSPAENTPSCRQLSAPPFIQVTFPSPPRSQNKLSTLSHNHRRTPNSLINLS